MAYKLKPMKERVSPRKWDKHIAKVEAHYRNGVYQRKRVK